MAAAFPRTKSKRPSSVFGGLEWLLCLLVDPALRVSCNSVVKRPRPSWLDSIAKRPLCCHGRCCGCFPRRPRPLLRDHTRWGLITALKSDRCLINCPGTVTFIVLSGSTAASDTCWLNPQLPLNGVGSVVVRPLILMFMCIPQSLVTSISVSHGH